MQIHVIIVIFSFRFIYCCLFLWEYLDYPGKIDYYLAYYEETYTKSCKHILISFRFRSVMAFLCQRTELSQAANPTNAAQAPINVNILFLLSFKLSYCEYCLLSENRREDTSYDHWSCAYAKHYQTKCDDHINSPFVVELFYLSRLLISG